jgi:hypothetical protein
MNKFIGLVITMFFAFCNLPDNLNLIEKDNVGTTGVWKMVYAYNYNLDGHDLKWPVNIDPLPYRIDYPTINKAKYLSVTDTAICIYSQNNQCLHTLHVGVMKINDSLFSSSTCISNLKLKDKIYLLKSDTLLYNWVDVSDCEGNAGYDSTNLGVNLSKMFFVRYSGTIPILDYPDCN